MTSEAREKFERWHARQYELGACRCPECKGKRDRAVAAFVAPDDVAERGSVEREAEAATPAPFDPEGVRRTFTVDSVLRAVEQATDAELRTAGGIEFSTAPVTEITVKPEEAQPKDRSWFLAQYRGLAEKAEEVGLPIEPPAPGEPDQRPYRGEDCSWFLVAQPGSPLAEWQAKLNRAKAGGGYDRNPEALVAYEKKLQARENEVIGRQYRADEREIQAERSRITYEEARASLEREFGKEAVGQAIDGLTRLLAIRDDVDRLVERSDQLSDAAIDLHEELEELQIKLKSNAKE